MDAPLNLAFLQLRRYNNYMTRSKLLASAAVFLLSVVSGCSYAPTPDPKPAIDKVIKAVEGRGFVQVGNATSTPNKTAHPTGVKVTAKIPGVEPTCLVGIAVTLDGQTTDIVTDFSLEGGKLTGVKVTRVEAQELVKQKKICTKPG